MFDELRAFTLAIYIGLPVLIVVLAVWTWWDKRKQHDSGCEEETQDE